MFRFKERMNFSEKGNRISDAKQYAPGKVTTLNPNAAEFVPFSLRSPSSSGSTSAGDGTTRFAASGTLGKPVLDRSRSSISNKSNEEAHRFWRSQLPKDITSDFKFINEEDSQGIGSGNLSLAGLSLRDGSKVSRFVSFADGEYVYSDRQELRNPYGNGNNIAENLRYRVSSYGADPTLASFLHLPAETLDEQLVKSDQLLGNGRQGHLYNRNSRHGLVTNMLREHEIMDGNGTEMNPVDFLVAQFPGFATESLAEAYFANSCDLNRTIEMLTQFEMNGSSDSTIGSSRSSHGSAHTYIAATTRGASADRVQTRGLARATGDAVANLYSELREEARDHARLDNACFKQARRAFLVGNKALAKQCSLCSCAAHRKARESIYCQRNQVSVSPENVRGKEHMIDLHGLHVSEAIHLLNHELSVLRSTARAADQHLQVYICVGTGHHTRGSRTPARLAGAVQRYLLEEECLEFTVPQTGLLRVVIY
ncbi:polyadenylate-binding protein-interacting protein 7 [Gossypium raimondii]|uniref:polyadenylate-binding protein-interacting protein 7 n=1 Tax=Gossypium raimondii TaxID=29730 RepID=UPI00227C41B9|nr:polyadenylate-binding protein-interacting protein 7 [Gossypium raimondii]